MNKRVIILVLSISAMTSVTIALRTAYRNTWVQYIPTTQAALDALPKNALRFEGGGFKIQRKNRP